VKVLIEGSIFLHQHFGGISKYIYKLNKNLNKQSIKSKIFSPVSISQYLNKKEKYIFSFLRMKKIPKFTRKLFFLINNILTVIYIFFYKPDIVHFSYYNNFLAKFLINSYVLTVYDLIHEKKKYNNDFFNKKKVIDNAKHIICISNQTKSDLKKFYNVSDNKISVISLGVDTVTKKKTKRHKFILFVGSRERYKNFNNLIKAFSRSSFLKKNYQIICFGGGNFSKYEDKKFNKLKISSNIYYKFGDDNELKKHYKKASLFITISTAEGFGLTPYEAISNGCPVVCSNIPVFKENLNGGCKFVNPLDINEIKSGIEKVLKDKTENAQNIKKGLKIIKNFTWKKTASETVRLYKKINL